MSTTVLVTAAGSAAAQAFIDGLRAQDELAVRVIGVDGSAYAGGLFDCERAYTVPRVDDERFLDAIAAICIAEGVDVLAPIGSFELEFFAAAANTLRERCGVRVITNSPEAVALARDKRAVPRRWRPTASTWQPTATRRTNSCAIR
jgi:carbamoyl-phosphate synthase large subunit